VDGVSVGGIRISGDSAFDILATLAWWATEVVVVVMELGNVLVNDLVRWRLVFEGCVEQLVMVRCFCRGVWE